MNKKRHLKMPFMMLTFQLRSEKMTERDLKCFAAGLYLGAIAMWIAMFVMILRSS